MDAGKVPLQGVGPSGVGPGGSSGASTSWTNFASTALEASRVVKASSGTLRDVYVYQASGSLLYLQLFNAAALPANGTVPSFTPIPVPTGSMAFIDFGTDGIILSTGIVAALSTTAATLTVAGAVGFFSGRFA